MGTIYMVLTMTRPVENQSGTLEEVLPCFHPSSYQKVGNICVSSLDLICNSASFFFPLQLFMHMSVCALCVYKCAGRPENHLKLELQMVVDHVGAVN